jgi:GMP synthase-like glutamine amidotransferase
MVVPAIVALRIAVLHCDSTPCDGEHSRQMIRQLLPDPAAQFLDFDAQRQEFPPSWDAFDAVVITGSTASVNAADAWVVRLAEEIRNIARRASAKALRVLGVCFGHQMLAHALGGAVSQHAEGLFFGPRRFLVSAHAQAGMLWEHSHMSLFCSHEEVVTLLPPGSRPFGVSSRCGVEGMVLGTHVLSVQGHPELSGDMGLQSVRALAAHFVDRGCISEQAAADAVAAASAMDAGEASLCQRALGAFLREGLKPGPLFGESGQALQPIMGFGSLLSEASARLSFPNLTGFRLARLRGFRRVMRHPASIFMERGIGRLQTQELASLCVEHVDVEEEEEEEEAGRGGTRAGFLVAAFNIPADELPAFFEREEEFFIVSAPIHELDGAVRERGLVCCASTDDEYLSRHGRRVFTDKYLSAGLDSIWNWSGPILPCRVYLRHCVLAAEKAGGDVRDDFVDSTLLADRRTTIREHLQEHPSIMREVPPPALAHRYSG